MCCCKILYLLWIFYYYFTVDKGSVMLDRWVSGQPFSNNWTMYGRLCYKGIFTWAFCLVDKDSLCMCFIAFKGPTVVLPLSSKINIWEPSFFSQKMLLFILVSWVVNLLHGLCSSCCDGSCLTWNGPKFYTISWCRKAQGKLSLLV